MCHKHILGLAPYALCAILTAACDQPAADPTAVQRSATPAQTAMSLNVALDSAESAVMNAILSRHPASLQNHIRAILADVPGRSVIIKAKTPDEQKLVDSLMSLRTARRMREAAGGKSERQPVPLTVVASASPLGSSYQGLLIRETRPAPHDVLLINAEKSTPADLAAAIRAVRRTRQRFGDTPTSATRIGLKWTTPARVRRSRDVVAAGKDLERLRHATTSDVAGVGEGRAIEVLLAATTSPQAAPR